MTELGVVAALLTALCIGYHFGRRAGTHPATWKNRTSRLTLGRLVINLLLVMTARRIRRNLVTRNLIADGLRIGTVGNQLFGAVCGLGSKQRHHGLPVRRRQLPRTRVGS